MFKLVIIFILYFNLMTQRKKLRQQVRGQRLNLSQHEQNMQSKLLCEMLIKEITATPAKHIAIYLANDGEVNAQTFINWCWQQGISVYLPIIHPFSKGQLLFQGYTEKTKLVKNQYGILEPKLDVRYIIELSKIDIIYTPLVAFDLHGNRLGMGGGFYDRTLFHWYKNYQNNKQTTPFPIGLAHDCQLVSEIPHEHWDIPLPKIITPTTSYSFDI